MIRIDVVHYRRLLTLAFALLGQTVAVSGCSHPAANSEEVGTDMPYRYIQPFGNAQLNSFLPGEIKAKGKAEWKLKYSEGKVPGQATQLHVFDSRRAIVDFQNVLFAVDLAGRKPLGFRDKSANTFVTLADDGSFRFFWSYRLVHLPFDDWRNEEAPDQFVKNLGSYTGLMCLQILDDSFVTGVLAGPDPESNDVSFILSLTRMGESMPEWTKEIPGGVVSPPISSKGLVALAREDTISVLRPGSQHTNVISGKFIPTAICFGPDDNIYIVKVEDDVSLLEGLSSEGESIWKVATTVRTPISPPIVSDEGTVFLVGPKIIKAYWKSEELWEYACASDHPRATVFLGGNLLVTDGNRVVLLTADGQETWIYEDPDGEQFMTAPVVDEQGAVYVASNEHIVKLK